MNSAQRPRSVLDKRPLSPREVEHSSHRNVVLQGEIVGQTTKLCQQHSAASQASIREPRFCSIHGSTRSDVTSGTVNGPMPVRVRWWMSERLLSKTHILYVASHKSARGGVNNSLTLLATDKSAGGPWKPFLEAKVVFLGEIPCTTLHSPSVFFDDDARTTYMFAHGHKCENVPGKQPTLTFSSTDSLTWRLISHEPAKFLHTRLFYLTPPTARHSDGFFYSVAKSQESSSGSGVLCRSSSLTGPYVPGPILSQGMRHADVHLVKDRFLFILFSLIGDAPERIMLGTVDTYSDTDWTSWIMRPGPVIIGGEDTAVIGEKSHGQAPSRPGPSSWNDGGVRDPRLLISSPTTPNSDEFSGYLFYSSNGESSISAALLEIDVSAYLSAVMNRWRENISPWVLASSSLGRSNTGKKSPIGLVTGTGRSGTMYTCRLFRAAGLNLSHDNTHDCAPSYPGPDGAVSWYDALFDGRQYDSVVHLVRDPLLVINSRVVKMSDAKNPASHAKFLLTRTQRFEESSDLLSIIDSENKDAMASFSLKHWVRRNSFVQRHAEWRETVEDLSEHALSAWNLCMALHFGARCPSLARWSQAILSIDTHTNTGQHEPAEPSTEGTDGHDTANESLWTWHRISSIGTVECEYARIALLMARKYGYYSRESPEMARNCTIAADENYECGFEGDKWDCNLSRLSP